ncbi:MAG: hypothetical protein HRT73_06625 [Flavobacteriales bacterium]|nr:hypothetical protein [Flavobacteriales bacterium]
MKKLNIYFFIGITFLFSSCSKTEFEEYEKTDGTANFSNYISVGNSFTQGLQDGGLHNEFGQQDNSYPAIIAKQMGTSFLQPLVSGDGSGYFHLQYVNGEIEVIKAFDIDITTNHPLAINYDPSFENWVSNTVKYNNLGVGGMNVRNVTSVGVNQGTDKPLFHVLFGSSAPGVLAWNGVTGEPISPFGRFLEWGSFGSEVEYIDNVIASDATFFTNWLGINDLMSWTKEGGDDVGGSAVLTDINEFRTKYDTVLDAFQTMGAQGVCATVHDIMETPYFTTITLDVLGKDIWIKEGADTTVIRKATDEDLILLTAKDVLGDGIGLIQSDPLPHTVVLDKDEVLIAKNYLNSINSEIRNSAAAHGYAIVDMHAFMHKLTSGLNFDGVAYNTEYIAGGAYSLDGLHPNGRGYAMIANEFIRTINANFESSLKSVSIGSYRGITFP